MNAVDICNLALGKIGDTAEVVSIDPPDGSVQASHCARLYPFALRSVLESHSWGFATKTANLVPLESTITNKYQYAIPNDFLRMIGIDDSDENQINYTIMKHPTGNQCIVVSELHHNITYISDDVDASQFSASFSDLLSSVLAHHLCGPIIKGDVGVSASNKLLQESIPFLRKLAIESDTKNHKKSFDYVPSGIRARRAFRRVGDA